MQTFEMTFDINEPPFKADSADAMEYSILGFCKAKDSSVSLERLYTLIAFPGKQFSGYEFLAYFYVSWAIAEPENLLDLGLPFHKAYSLAKKMYETRK